MLNFTAIELIYINKEKSGCVKVDIIEFSNSRFDGTNFYVWKFRIMDWLDNKDCQEPILRKNRDTVSDNIWETPKVLLKNEKRDSQT